jgi:topoisomerase IA-like protein
MFDYSYTAKMESELDHIAKGARAWKTLLQENWDLYKDRYQNHIANAPEGGKQKVANKRDLGEGICVVLSRKGPLLLKEETKEFASLPPRTSFETVTLAQAKAAYKAKDGTELGSYDSKPILKKKGPYGFYAQWEAVKVPYKPEDTLEVIIAKIKQKGGIVDPASTTDPTNTNAPPPPFERKVGEFTIRRGPYGLYFFKNTAKKAAFASFPAAANENTVTEAELPELYTAALAAKKRRPPKK